MTGHVQSDEEMVGMMTTSDAAGTPRTRWAAILWGIVLAAIASVSLWVILSPEGPESFVSWLIDLTPLSVVAYSVVAVGALLLLAGIAGLARRAQMSMAQRSGD
jgi:hypothetical protein